MSQRTYKEAVDCLNSLQSNAAALEASRQLGASRLVEYAIPEMIESLERIGYKQEELNKLNVIHVTGTKGKGSTCAFTDSILRTARPSWKVGLFTSPHLVAVRERIRINGSPISEEQFAKYFFDVWDRLGENDKRRFDSSPLRPAYFRFITLVAYHAFLSLKVDATILEVGVGGRYDSTNIVPKPLVTGISALGIDHVTVLGKTLPEIAWQKAGIYKEGVPAITVAQPDEAMDVLRKQAGDIKASEFVVARPVVDNLHLKLGLAGTHQISNANLSIHLAQTVLRDSTDVTSSSLPQTYVEGLRNARWPGRCQSVADPASPKTTWHLDGAHTIESLQCCMNWFVSPEVGLPEKDANVERPTRVLIFNCTNGRSGSTFLGTMLATASDQLKKFNSDEKTEKLFDHVIFCTNVTYADGGFKGDLTTRAINESDLAQLKTQQDIATAWKELVPTFPDSNVHVLPSIEHALRVVRNPASVPMDVLVAGSLHLVGGVIEVAGLADVAL